MPGAPAYKRDCVSLVSRYLIIGSAKMAKTLFLTLRLFSATGGIEKVCRIMGKALYEESIADDSTLQICSMYDHTPDAFDNPYFPAENFKGFGINKFRFTRHVLANGPQYDVVILSHINLLLIGFLIKKLSPSTTTILLAHGVEIWTPLSKRKKTMLLQCDLILAVSAFTQSKVIQSQGVAAGKCVVLNNCLDPFLPLPAPRHKSDQLSGRYGFLPGDIVMLTLTRMRSTEQYKGYDKVLEALAMLHSTYPTLKYLLAGSYDAPEKECIDQMVKQYGLQQQVVMPGYIGDDELPDHFALCDMYIMPSRGEGFGIVFIEAMYYGLPVIAGNEDGSTDALLHGTLGQLVNPIDVPEIVSAIENIIKNKSSFNPDPKVLMKHFSYETYKQHLGGILNNQYQKELIYA